MNSLEPIVAAEVIMKAFSCDGDLARLVAAKARYRNFPAHGAIVRKGRAEDQVYLVIAGHARMLALAVDGRFVVVNDYGSGDIFGEGSLLDTPTETEEVAAVVPVDAEIFPTPVFVGLMSNYSCIALAVSRVLVARLGQTRRRMIEGATLSAAGRIHAELLRQARAGEAMTIRPAPVLSQFALAVQSTRETVSRTISSLEKRGIIRRDEQVLTVVAPHRLEELIF